jgi:exopolysaccharide biosynthesis protein
VSDRKIAVDPSCSSSFCRANPRTGLGVTATGRILLVVVDGRQSRWSVGATMYRFAAIMKDLGAVEAVNLDGGGSSTMVVRGKVVNRPSDGFQRKVSNAAVILPRPEGS